MNKKQELDKLEQDLIQELIQYCKRQGVDAEQFTKESKTDGEEYVITVDSKHDKEEWERFALLIADPCKHLAFEAIVRRFKEYNNKIYINHIDLMAPKEGNLYFKVECFKHRSEL